MKKRRLWLAVGTVVVAGGVIGVLAMRGRDGDAPAVQTARTSRQTIVQKANGTGKIQPKTQVKISADVSAKITRLAVVEGQWVEQGDLLLELDRERYLALVESAEANVGAAEANLKLAHENLLTAERELARSRELLGQDLESQALFEDKQAAYQVQAARHEAAGNQVQQARAALKQARDDLSKTTIYAPMSGTISDLYKEQGEIAVGSAFQPDIILVLADLAEMEARINVDENDIVAIAIGQEAEIEVDALPGEVLRGVVSEIANSANVSGAGTADQKTEFEIKIAIQNPPPTLRPGMTAAADISTQTNDSALSVPIQCVAVRTVDQLATGGESRDDAAKRYTADRDGFVEVVFRIEEGKAVARQVKTGIQSDELIEVVEGLAEGDEVVSGSYRAISKDLVNGAVVRIDNTGGAESAGEPDVAR